MLLAGNAHVKNPRFDVTLGTGDLSSYPEGNMWYEMSQKKDLVFLQIPEDLRQKLAKEHRGELVALPFRYLGGLDDEPHPTSGLAARMLRTSEPPHYRRSGSRRLAEPRPRREEPGLKAWDQTAATRRNCEFSIGRDPEWTPTIVMTARCKRCFSRGKAEISTRSPGNRDSGNRDL
jgi:hypothetical protein